MSLEQGGPKSDAALLINSSKTEFLFIGLKQQLSKIHDSSLTTTHSTRKLGTLALLSRRSRQRERLSASVLSNLAT